MPMPFMGVHIKIYIINIHNILQNRSMLLLFGGQTEHRVQPKMHRFSGTEIHPGGATQDECGWWFSAVMSCLRTCLGKDPGANICAGRLPFTHPSPNVWTNVHPHKQRACWQDLLSETQHGFLLACSLKRLHLLLGCTPIHGIYNLKSWQQRLVVGAKKLHIECSQAKETISGHIHGKDAN